MISIGHNKLTLILWVGIVLSLGMISAYVTLQIKATDGIQHIKMLISRWSVSHDCYVDFTHMTQCDSISEILYSRTPL